MSDNQERGEVQLVNALERGNLDKFRECLRNGASPNVLAADDMPVLITAALRGQPEFVKELIAARADLECMMGGKNAVMWLSWLGRLPEQAACASLLIDAGINISHPASNGATALDMAVSWGNTDIARKLHAKGAPCSKTTAVALRSLLEPSGQGRRPSPR